MKYWVEVDGELFEVESDAPVEINQVVDGVYSVLVNGRTWLISLEEGQDGMVLEDGHRQYHVRIQRAIGSRETFQKQHSHADIRSPIPGLVVKVLVEEGQRVEKGQSLVIIEAMKMRNHIKSPMDGVVRDIKVAEGKAVGMREFLMRIES